MRPNPEPLEPLPQSRHIYSCREWARRFLGQDTHEDLAFELWFQYVRTWSEGVN